MRKVEKGKEKKKKVLIVDDDADFVEMNKIVLEKAGYEVIAAYSGKEGLEKAHSEKPNIIILDVMMETGSVGFDVCRKLRNSEQTKNIPQIMVTSVNETVPYKFSPDETWLPTDCFLEKPVAPDRLLEEVKKRIK
ncbi:MAG: response regulator [Planctomycetota bacterium]|nr:response regulator [Planctomycetota bacterium]